MNDLVRQKLFDLVNRFGTDIGQDSRRCEALLRDVCGDKFRREVSVLVCATKEQIPPELATKGNAPKEVILQRLSKRLQDNCGLDENLSRWAVESWALALGVFASDKIKYPFSCPSCGAKGFSQSNIAGKRVRCPQCKVIIRVSDDGKQFSSDDNLGSVVSAASPTKIPLNTNHEPISLNGAWRGSYTQQSMTFPLEIMIEEHDGRCFLGTAREPTPIWAKEQGYLESHLQSEISGIYDEKRSVEFSKFYPEFGYGVEYKGTVSRSGVNLFMEGDWSVGDQTGRFKLAWVSKMVDEVTHSNGLPLCKSPPTSAVAVAARRVALTRPPPTHSESIEVEAVLNRFFAKSKGGDNIYFDPAIPLDKLTNAIDSYPIPVDELVLAVYDNTGFGGAKDGYVITNMAVYAHDMGGATKRIALTDVRTVRVTKKSSWFGDEVALNGQHFVTLNFGNRSLAAAILIALKALA